LLLQGFEGMHPVFDDIANVANGKACTKVVHYMSPQTNAVQPEPTMMIRKTYKITKKLCARKNISKNHSYTGSWMA